MAADNGYMIHPEGYIPRIIDAKVERYLRVFGAVEIAGTKWCGKTWTALQHGANVSYVDNFLDLARDDPSAMLIGDRPHVIDEWQHVPVIWDTVRHEIDRTRGLRGAWILTGSSASLPKDIKEGSGTPSHSGAGRIGRIHMRPMSLQESGDSTAEISLAGLFRGEFEPIQKKTDAATIVELVCRGGWPEAIDLNSEDAQLIAREYLRLLRTEDFPRQGKDAEIARRLLFSLARNLGQAATYKTVIGDMDDGSAADTDGMNVTEKTITSYLDLLRDVYLLEELPGWAPPARSPKRVAMKPKRYLVDPSLAVATLGMSAEALMNDWQTFGLMFENLCIWDLAIYMSALEYAADPSLRYFRDDTGLEADVIIECTDGRWAAFEIKTSERKVSDGIDSLCRLRDKLTAESAARTRAPEFMAVITVVSEYARKVEDGLYVISITALGA